MKNLLVALVLIILPTVVWAWTPKEVKKFTPEELKARLTAIQFSVTQKEDTERPYSGDTWHNEEQGIYVDVVSGEPLFDSTRKFDSGTGWPSFYAPLVKENVLEKSDHQLGVERTEVRSKFGNSHLGHVFKDGPKPTGLRYCMNSAALRFIPKSKLKESGYGEYLSLFAAQSPQIVETKTMEFQK